MKNILNIRTLWTAVAVLTISSNAFTQNPLFIPPTLSGTNFNIDVQNGVTQFYPGINTATFGMNGPLLGPTIILNKWDTVSFNVTNNLTGMNNPTTMHWHGLHVPAVCDGGPHQPIPQGSTWSPVFRVLNEAGTYWYHPHGDGMTNEQVAMGLAGMIIVKDSLEAALNLPRTYGVDDFPLIVQTKAFDATYEIVHATELDTVLLINGTRNPYIDAPAQIVRMRLLNGSSSRAYNFGFTGNQPFEMIASDGGLLDSAITLTRILLSPGERAEILIDLQGMAGQTIHLKSYSSEMPNGIYGAATVTGSLGGNIPFYNLNPLNGADFDLLQINVTAQLPNAVTTFPTTMSNNIPWTSYSVSRYFSLGVDSPLDPVAEVIGPFNINGVHFDMMVINTTIYLGNSENWRVTNLTGLAHPFHIHDNQFYLLSYNGGPVPEYLKSKKDVVLIMPGEFIEFVTKFEDYANDTVPFMYHCHLLMHEDEGMMGSFRVIDTNTTSLAFHTEKDYFRMYPNPANAILQLETNADSENQIDISDVLGNTILNRKYISGQKNIQINLSDFSNGLYLITIRNSSQIFTKKILVQH